MAYRLKFNRRADVSITLLVIGVFAVCTLAIVSFLLNGRLSQGSFANMEIFENLSSQAEDFYFYADAGYSMQEAAEKIGAQLQDNKLTLSAEQKTSAPLDFITKKEPSVVLSVRYTIDLSK